MTLNKIKDFAQTREAGAFAKAVEARTQGAELFAPAVAPARFNLLKAVL
jgi:hypothetical protein